MLTTFLRAQVLSGKDADARAFLEPLLSQGGDVGRAWRSIWMQLAGQDVKGAEVAADWLRHVEPKTPAATATQLIPGGSTVAFSATFESRPDIDRYRVEAVGR